VKDPFRLKVWSVPYRRASGSLLFSEIMDLLSENHTKRVKYIVWAKFGMFNVRSGGTYNNNCV